MVTSEVPGTGDPGVRAARFTAASRAAVAPFHVMDLLAAAVARRASHGDVLDLVAGQPSTPAPRAVRAEAARLLNDGAVLGYTPAVGIPALREVIAGAYGDRHGLTVDASDVVITTGSSGGFLLSFLGAFEAGERVAMARPGYPCYRNVLSALGCEVVELATDATTRFQPTVEMVAAAHAERPLAGLVVASPANPTGTMLSPADLSGLARWCEEHGVRLVSDEIYHGLVHGELAATSAWQTSRTGLVLGSFSKYFSMTGWRVGWMLVPADLRRTVDVLAGNFTICAPVLSQHAAVAAFTPDASAELAGHVDRYRENRDVLMAELPRLGVDRLAPADGAFYVYADVAHLTGDSLAWTRRLLDDTGVAIAPGIDFDTVDGHAFVRFSCAGDTAEVHAALERLSRWIPAVS